MADLQLIAGTFEEADAVAHATTAARDIAEHFPHIHNHNVALLFRNANGELQIQETAETRELNRDATVGTVLGWLAGFANAIVGGPLGPAQGAPLGQAVGRENSGRDIGFSNDFLRDLAETLSRGEAAVLAAAPEQDAPALLETLQRHGGLASVRELRPDALAG